MNEFEPAQEVEEQRRGSTLRDSLQLLRRRKWIVLQALVLVPAVAVALSSTQPARYQAEAQVLLTYQSFAGLAANVQDANPGQTADRSASTQADLARVPSVINATLAAVPNAGMTATELLNSSAASAASGTDLLSFSVTARTPALATRLATAYSRAYVDYRHRLDTTALQRAGRDVRARIRELQDTGGGGSALADKLHETQQQLQTLETLQTSNATVVRTASRATQVAPTPVRDGVLAVALGLVVGVGLALLVDALDTRVRSAEEIAARLGIPLLGRLPEPPKKLRDRHALVMLQDPYGRHAESFRMLRTSLELANIEQEAKVMAITSALPGEGKSTTIANLAVAVALAGHRVALVDLDLRKPVLKKFFDPAAGAGITDVALGHVTLASALVRMNVESFLDEQNGADGDHRGHLDVLVAGQLPPDPGEFVASRRVASILAELRADYDVVLVDTPPLLTVGDALALSSHVDAFMLVSNLALSRRGELQELRRALAFSRCVVLGTVLTGASAPTAYGYSGYGGAGAVPQPKPGRGTTPGGTTTGKR